MLVVNYTDVSTYEYRPLALETTSGLNPPQVHQRKMFLGNVAYCRHCVKCKILVVRRASAAGFKKRGGKEGSTTAVL